MKLQSEKIKIEPDDTNKMDNSQIRLLEFMLEARIYEDEKTYSLELFRLFSLVEKERNQRGLSKYLYIN